MLQSRVVGNQFGGLDCLNHRVMKFTGEPVTLGDPLVKPGIHRVSKLPQANSVENPKNDCPCKNTTESKPGRLVISRQDSELQAGAGLIPAPTVVTSHYMKSVYAWSKIVVKRLA